jgi:hypothetical protein
MASLKNQIQQLEQDIAAEKACLHQNSERLKQHLVTPEIMAFAIASGFTLGYIIGHKNTTRHIKHVLKIVPSIMNELLYILKIISTITI